MNSRLFLAGLVTLSSLLVAAAPGLTASNYSFPVSVKSGKCPKFAKIATSIRTYEGGGEWTVSANMSGFAGSARLVSKNRKSAIFRAPLKYNFRSCRGVAVSSDGDFSPYRFNFKDGSVTFRVVLPKDTESNPSAITQATISNGRPFVKWAIAD